MSPAAVNVSARLSRWRGASSLCLCAYATVWPEDSAVAALSSHDIACSFMVMRHAATRTWTRIDLFVLSLSPRCGPTGLLRGQGWHALSVLRYTSTSSGLQLLDLGTLISLSSLCARVWRERTCGLRYCIILYPTKALIAQRSVKVRSRARVSPTPALHDCAVALTPRALPSWQVHGHP